MEKKRMLLVLGILELLVVLVLLLLYNIEGLSFNPFPSLVSLALLWFLAGSGTTLLFVSFTES